MNVQDLIKSYGHKTVVSEVSFEVPKGKVLSLIGPNGAGKSTVMGMISPTTPELYHGHPIDPHAEDLVSFARVDLEDIVVMDHEPPIDDCSQEKLPY